MILATLKSEYNSKKEWFKEILSPYDKVHHQDTITGPATLKRNYYELWECVKQPINALIDLGRNILSVLTHTTNFFFNLFTYPIQGILLGFQQASDKLDSNGTNLFCSFINIASNLFDLVTTPIAWAVKIPARLIATAFDKSLEPAENPNSFTKYFQSALANVSELTPQQCRQLEMANNELMQYTENMTYTTPNVRM